MSEQVTCLLALLRECEQDEREWLAEQSGTTVNYLYILAGGGRQSPKAALAAALEDASRALSKKTKGRTRIVTMRDLAVMNSVSGLKG